MNIPSSLKENMPNFKYRNPKILNRSVFLKLNKSNNTYKYLALHVPIPWMSTLIANCWGQVLLPCTFLPSLKNYGNHSLHYRPPTHQDINIYVFHIYIKYSFHSFNYKLIDNKSLLGHLPGLHKAQLYASRKKRKKRKWRCYPSKSNLLH